MSVYIFSAIIAILMCAIFVIPRLTPQNSFGMMLDGFPIKDLFEVRFLLFFIVLAIQSSVFLHSNSAITIWVTTSLIFVFFSIISGWLLFYSLTTIVTNTFVGACCLYMFRYHHFLLAIFASLLFLYASYHLYSFSYQNIAVKKRYERWIKQRKKHYVRKFGEIMPKDKHQRCLVLSLIFIEDMSRPRIVRFYERTLHTLRGGVMSTGIMQVQNSKNLSDRQSVILGVKHVKKLLLTNKIHPFDTADGFRDFAHAWNGDKDYRFLLHIVYAIIKKDLN